MTELYCPECQQVFEMEQLDKKKCYIKMGFKSIPVETAFICPNCGTLIIGNMYQLWEEVKKFYKEMIKVEKNG